jgi:hypothetical protein
MNLALAIELYCAGTSEGAKKAWDERGRSNPKDKLLEKHDFIKRHPIRVAPGPAEQERLYNFMNFHVKDLFRRAEAEYGQYDDWALESAKESLERADDYANQGRFEAATSSQDMALSKLHGLILRG